ncbi:uncharacterized protein BT62DRAFT_1079149 [Guyanagaster necrorhizus]|uniref:Uncharacterized protein n=1 Tax=Guyanagaster necrorhizus TaxID=856835 RepID=A0A9P7VL22_9AGAR|nr:uncharacterized protein BT62DRAFT_1079149 [Guyanagaster necrorhizus MCA 3950]KAG7442538.1 hypothetical protein BT62DRAFT_1079149 [Guyanagaster necrorhizus MCA 3950]
MLRESISSLLLVLLLDIILISAFAMGIIYPDNQNRADRVKQLATDIGSIQSVIKDNLQDAKDEALKNFTAEDREKYIKMVKALHGKDDSLNLGLKVSGTVAAAAFFCGAGAAVATKLLNNGLLRMHLQTIATGLSKALSGGSKEGLEVMKTGSDIIHTGLEAEEITETVARGLHVLKIAATVLTVVGVILDGTLLIYEAIAGEEQLKEQRKGIKELCVRRFTVKKLQECFRDISLFATDVKGAVDLEDTLRELVKDGTLTEGQMKTKLEKKYNGKMNHITDKDVWEKLDDEDNQSGVPWRDEDPSLAAIQKYIEEELEVSGKA